MRCKTCAHILWNQPAPLDGSGRACSECGSPYRVADFGFVAGKVQFRCPHCAIAYYGTSVDGHLQPSEFQCAGCNTRISMEQCTLVPVDGDGSGGAMLLRQVPWLDAGGIVGRWFRTLGIGFAGAGGVHPRLTSEPDGMRAAAFLASVALPSSLMSAGFVLLMSSISLLSGSGPGRANWVGVALAVLITTAQPLLLVGVAFLAAFFAGRVAGAAGPGTTRILESICYVSGPLILSAIPICGCGAMVGGIWWIVSASIATSVACAGPRAGLATLVALLTMLFGVLAWALSGFAMQSLVGF